METTTSKTFFGRVRALELVKNKLRKNRLLALTAPHQSGKSSFIHQALVPDLQDGDFQGLAGSEWLAVFMDASQDFLENMAAAFSKTGILYEDKVSPDFEERLYQSLDRKQTNIVQLYRESSFMQQYNLLIVVDNFDALFEDDQAADKAYLSNLLVEASMAKDIAVYVLLVMNTENVAAIPKHGKYEILGEAMTKSQYQLHTLSQEDLNLAIQSIIEEKEAKISDKVVNDILEELYWDTEQLPKLKNYISKIKSGWTQPTKKLFAKEEKKEEIKIEKPKPKPKPKPNLSSVADKIFKQLPTRYQQQICEAIFRLICIKDEELGSFLIEERSVAEIAQRTGYPAEEIVRVVDNLKEEEVLFVDTPTTTEKSLVYNDDETILEGWQRLEDWVHAEKNKKESYFELVQATENYHDNRRNTNYLLKGDTLEKMLNWKKVHQPDATWAAHFVGFDFDKCMQFLLLSEETAKTPPAPEPTPPPPSRPQRPQPKPTPPPRRKPKIVIKGRK